MTTNKGCAPGKSSLIGLGSARDYDGCAILQAKTRGGGGETERSDAAAQSGKTPNDTGPDSHHSSESVRCEDPPRARIKSPRGRRAVWMLK